MNTDVVIIGGGLAGLTCAVGLAGSGLKVILLEGRLNLGGRARSWVDRKTGDTVDIGPHVFTTLYRNMFRLLDQLGTRADVVWHTDKLITLVDGDASVVMRTHPRLPAPLHLAPGFLRALHHAAISLQDLRSNRRVARLAMRVGEEELMRLDDVPASEFLRELGVSPRFAEWFWASVSMSITNVPLDQCSAGALLRFFQMMIGHRDFRFGFAGRGLGELYTEQASALVHANGGRVFLDAQVKQIAESGDATTGVVLHDGTRIGARYCVSAVPPQSLAELIPPTWAERYKVFNDAAGFQPNPYVSVYLWFARKITRERFWARLWSPRNLNYDFYDLSNIRPHWRDRPSVIASNIIYSYRAHMLSDAQIIDTTVQELAEYMPEAADTRIVHALVNRVPMAIPCPFPGTEKRRPSTRTPIRGLFLAGDWTHTDLPACMESAVRSGWLAAEQIWRELGQPRQLALPVDPLTGLTGLVRRFYARRAAAHA